MKSGLEGAFEACDCMISSDGSESGYYTQAPGIPVPGGFNILRPGIWDFCLVIQSRRHNTLWSEAEPEAKEMDALYGDLKDSSEGSTGLTLTKPPHRKVPIHLAAMAPICGC
jgi:hypothetical protein